jgi:oxygen-independent coproporphyrinogen-3 oxidase
MLGGNRRVGQVRLGGGTPTFLSSEELRSLMRALGDRFELLPGERAIEIDPRSVDDEKMAALGQVGFNHLSVGVQDFNADVQRAINRVQSEEQTARAISVARKHGVSSVSIDLVYGLPLQTVISFDHTLDRVLALKPDRIALYSYRHAPGRFKSQRRHHNDVLPSAEVKLQIMSLAVYKLNAAGYDYIGKDHFALAHDELAVATRRPGPLVGLQAHSWQASGDLLAFGISAISRIGATYSQNVKTLGEYYDRLDRGEIPVLRGIELTADDLLRRTVIESLLCRFALSIESVEIAHLIKFRQYFADEWLRLEHLERDGLVTLEPDWISVTPSGRLMVRSIAMIFDRYLTRSEQREQFSGLL